MSKREGKEPVIIEYDAIITEAETAKAWLLQIEGEEIWFPKSICILDEDDSTIEAPKWLADEKNVEYSY
jgi:hypothetical protein